LLWAACISIKQCFLVTDGERLLWAINSRTCVVPDLVPNPSQPERGQHGHYNSLS
jgi:hypothetical protein